MKLEDLNFYSFFTKFSLMDEYGFSSGLANRVFRKILPIVPDENSVEYILIKKKQSVSNLLSIMDFDNLTASKISKQLDLSIQALCAKVAAFGLDNQIKAKYSYIDLDSKPFEDLMQTFDTLEGGNTQECLELIDFLEAIDTLIIDLRKKKGKIGTNLHLTLTTKRILEYTKRIRELLHLKINISSTSHWEHMFTQHIHYIKKKDSIRRYVVRHTDLVALEIVEHTSNKGEKYIAEDQNEYWKFFHKSLLGGGIIAIFAFIKIVIGSYELTQFWNALYFSINYALCFIIVKQLGGIIATKQPAMTASTIAKNIDKQGNLKLDSINSITKLVRKVFRTQFISIIGNFIMAFTFACLVMYGFQLTDSTSFTEIVNPDYLIKNVIPSGKLIAFAAIAGCFLALSGLISGYIDNKVVASKIAYRIQNSPLFFNSKRLASFAEKKAGALIGNICLGFFLGSTFLLSNLLPFAIDIRHIAFSSANVGYAIMNYSFELNKILLALAGALLVGLINFIVSFSITLYLALKSRGVSFKLIPKLLLSILVDFIKNPLIYFFKKSKQ